MRIGILTSTETRHRYFVNRLRGEVPVVAVVYERTGYTPAVVNSPELKAEEAQIVAGHFAERARQEEIWFGAEADFVAMSAPPMPPSPRGGEEGAVPLRKRGVVRDGRCAVRHIEPGELNTDATLQFLEAAGVDTVAVFGTNLVKPPLLDHWPGRMVNMHLGLSPYYRGAGTNFYALLNEEPEYVGATVHLLDSGIDSGPILGHAQPVITPDDMPHTIGCKAILGGIDKLIAVLRDLDYGRLTPVPQWEVPNPRVYLRKHYHPRQVVDLYEKLEAGLIPRYVERSREAAARVRLVE